MVNIKTPVFTILLLSSLFLYGIETCPINPKSQIQLFIQQEIHDKFFSGIQIIHMKHGKVIYEHTAGTITFDSDIPVHKYTLFDIASLTKPLITLAIFAWLDHTKILSFHTPVSEVIPEIQKEITILDLLDHKSGLPPFRSYFRMFGYLDTYEEKKDAIIHHIAHLSKNHPDKYSDINYILLGFILERIFDRKLESIVSLFLKEIDYHGLPPFYVTGKKIHREIFAATSTSSATGGFNHGVVEDPNCFFLERACAHAGLFASAEAVAMLLYHLMQKQWYEKLITHAVGFDTPSINNSAYGASPEPYLRGHLGYSGTAFLIDYKKDTISVILTNRSHSHMIHKNFKTRMRHVRQTIFDLLRSID